MSVAPCLLFAQAEGADSLTHEPDEASAAYGAHVSRRVVRDSIFWSHVPQDCHIDWRRKRERPLIDLCMDLAHFFNTYDTTYVERNRYDFRAMATNTDFFQIYRIAGRDQTTGERQLLTFVPGRSYKVGPRGGWRWINVGYTFGVMPDGESQSSELNFAAYNSRIGCDMNWQRSSSPFTLRRVRGVSGLPEYSVKGRAVDGVSASTIALNVYAVANYRRFSYPAAYNACTVQLKSAGSLIVGASYDYQRFHFDPDAAESVIRDVIRDVNPTAPCPTLIDQLRVHTVNYHRIGVNVGYAYNWVPAPHWLVSGSISPSFGFKKQVGEGLSRDMLIDNFRNFHVDAIFRAGVTYNRQRWFAGASAVSYLYDYRHTNYDLNNAVTYLKVYVGVQFHKRRKFRRDTDRSKW